MARLSTCEQWATSRIGKYSLQLIEARSPSQFIINIGRCFTKDLSRAQSGRHHLTRERQFVKGNQRKDPALTQFGETDVGEPNQQECNLALEAELHQRSTLTSCRLEARRWVGGN